MSDTLQTDWDWIRKVLRMAHDRWADGQRLQLYRPPGWSKEIDMRQLECDAMRRWLSDICSDAEVVEPIEPEDADAPQS